MRYTHLLFDLDGTLVDSLADLTTSVNLLRAERGLATLPAAQVAEATGDGAAALVKRCLPDGGSAPEALERFLAFYAGHLLDATHPYPGIVALLESLGSAPLAVVTNKPLAQTLDILDGLDLRRFFAAVVGGGCAPAKKPSPLPLQLALQRLGCRDGTPLMIGDHHTDLRAGIAAGLDTCFCSWGLGHDDGLPATLRAASPTELQRLLGEDA